MTRDAQLRQVDSALARQMQSLAKQEHDQRQAINDSGYMQLVAVEELTHTAARGLVEGIAEALETSHEQVSEFLDKLTEGEPPPQEELDQRIESAEEGLEQGLGELLEKMSDGLGQSESSLGKAGDQRLGLARPNRQGQRQGGHPERKELLRTDGGHQEVGRCPDEVADRSAGLQGERGGRRRPSRA